MGCLSTLPITIYRGESKAIDIYLRDENGVSVDLTGLTELEATLPPATGTTPISILFSATEIVVVGIDELGHIRLQWPAVKTLLVALTAFDADTQPNYTTLTLKITKGTDPAFSPAIIDVVGAHNIIDP